MNPKADVSFTDRLPDRKFDYKLDVCRSENIAMSE